MNLTPQRIMHLELWGATDTQHGDDGGIRAAPRFKLAIVDAPTGECELSPLLQMLLAIAGPVALAVVAWALAWCRRRL